MAFHPNLPQLYRRQDVYRILGFDDFVHDTKMHFDQRIGHDLWISAQTAR